ncbi:hypothetical protein EDE15_4137 [Edaphobacter aggregans]|uniref:Uncharacterized protein n=1 Tax=Edaphobacter aggregans TaxID=570835 RepID=A0A3R9PCC4_9BACT|nr:permease [Edaphobacter aggregans]RSL18548.1 hypothetical protein EDE15_4137 [Edaphobacter aggregans]
MTRPWFNPRIPSLLRGSILVLVSLSISLLLSHFPHNHATMLLAIPALTATAGTIDTVRCLQGPWSFYHAGVILFVYMDLMALCMILFFLLYPYAHWITSSQ